MGYLIYLEIKQIIKNYLITDFKMLDIVWIVRKLDAEVPDLNFPVLMKINVEVPDLNFPVLISDFEELSETCPLVLRRIFYIIDIQNQKWNLVLILKLF